MGFFNMDNYITYDLIDIVWTWISYISIPTGIFFFLYGAFSSNPLNSILYVIFVFGGLFLFRLFLEFISILFKIEQKLEMIEKNTKKKK